MGSLLLKGARQPPGTAAEPGRTAGGDLWSGLRPRGEDRRCLRPPGPPPARFDSINTERIRDTSSPAERRPSLGRCPEFSAVRPGYLGGWPRPGRLGAIGEILCGLEPDRRA